MPLISCLIGISLRAIRHKASVTSPLDNTSFQEPQQRAQAHPPLPLHRLRMGFEKGERHARLLCVALSRPRFELLPQSTKASHTPDLWATEGNASLYGMFLRVLADVEDFTQEKPFPVLHSLILESNSQHRLLASCRDILQLV